MASKPKENVVRLFQDAEPDLAETALDVSHITALPPLTIASQRVTLDLTGAPKAIMAIGLGSVGKTTLLRWICEKAIEHSAELLLATVDPINRELAHYFPTAASPKTQDPAQIVVWLEQVLQRLMRQGESAAIDFGGGDTSLIRLVSEVSGLAGMMEEAGVHPVAFHLLSPRSSDLTPLLALEKAGFQPKATALILNEGRADTTRDREQQFAQIRRHSIYRAALARGAMEIWMPRLHAAKPIEDRRISFAHAVAGTMPEGRSDPGLGIFDRSRTHRWLTAMDEAFAPIASWLP
jgi:hypothetical protein